MDEFRKGYPEKNGWYDCMADGVCVPLKYFYCCMRGAHEWIAEDGTLVNETVLWKGPVRNSPEK